ncbi:MAG: hydroxylamine reductase [Proteobacteria bacterium]|nr:hydroxylamine reductase [Pseudomonadota bacterium]
MSMFCYQCQEAAGNKGCDKVGVCGKKEDVANLQDLLTYLLKGISIWTTKARELGVTDADADLFVVEGLFSTVTNVNFDEAWFTERIENAIKVRGKVQTLFTNAYKKANGSAFDCVVHDAATWSGTTREEFFDKAIEVGVMSEENTDIRSLKELLIYGLKGIAAYVDHAHVLDYKNEKIFAFIGEALATTTEADLGAGELTGLVLKTGEVAVDAMELLDRANTSTYGAQEMTEVFTGLIEGPGILVSGHDLRDIKELLVQTEGKGVNIYTHSEMLPAHAYGELKKHKHLIGNYGTAWYNQHKEFDAFKGSVLMTTNCIKKPKDSYAERIFTTGLVGWPGVAHIDNRKEGEAKDFTAVIEKALELGSIVPVEGKKLTIGFAKDQLMAVADKVVEAVNSGAIRRFVVMGGCDGHSKGRDYYTELARGLPNDTVILTAGCAKYRYNMLDLGEIDGIPRVLDAGQCNDSYSLAYIALKLKEAFGLDDINDLPISYEIAWYEQKAVTVLLALLHLGVKGIRLGPSLPAFLSPGVVKVLVDNFDIKGITTVEEALEEISAAPGAAA